MASCAFILVWGKGGAGTGGTGVVKTSRSLTVYFAILTIYNVSFLCFLDSCVVWVVVLPQEF